MIRFLQSLERRSVRLGFLGGIAMCVAAVFIVRTMWPQQAGESSSPALRAWSDTRDIAFGLRGYYSDNNRWPEGDLARIAAILKGDNPTHQIYIFEIPRDATGQFIDPWGTPYRIDLTPPNGPYVYSCGPNQRDDSADQGGDDIASWR